LLRNTHLTLYETSASSYWQVRAFVHKTLVRRSTKYEALGRAITFAKEFYQELLLKKAQNQPLTESAEFNKVALLMIEEDRQRATRGECSESVAKDAEYILKADLEPFFGKDQLQKIDYERITAYVGRLQQREVSSNTIKNHFMVLRKILVHAHKLKKLNSLPMFPTISKKDNPREWFNDEQYETLQKVIRKTIQDKVEIRLANRRLLPPITEQLRDLTNFMVNTFLRPQDIKLLQNRHITVIKHPTRGMYLRIMAKGK
jgi:hypothetical protein